MLFLLVIIAVLLFVIVWAHPATRKILLEGGGGLVRRALWALVIGAGVIIVLYAIS